MTNLHLLRKNFFDAKTVLGNVKVPNAQIGGIRVGAKELSEARERYELARDKYLSVFLYHAADLIATNVSEAREFYYKSNSLYVKRIDFDFAKYNPTHGDSGLYGALPWDDLELILTTSAEMKAFEYRGVSIEKVSRCAVSGIVFSEVLA